MHRSVLFCLLLSFCLLLGKQASCNTNTPLFKAETKERPASISAVTPSPTASPNQNVVVNLGSAGDIGRVKKRVYSPAKQRSISLPNIARQISSKCVMVMDAHSGETIYAKSPDVPRQPASTIKVLTGMIALKSLAQEEMISVSSKASGMPSSKIYLDPKKKYQADDLINAVLLASANDASVALAEKIAGSENKFAHMMTLRAKFWGARKTICKTASGLTAKGQQSTARDLANIFRHAMRNPEFADRMKTRRTQTSFGKTLYNHNKALWRVKGSQGGKTGYTNAARQTYVGQFQRDGETIIVAIMGSETMWHDVKKLVDYGFKKKMADKLAKAEVKDIKIAVAN